MNKKEMKFVVIGSAMILVAIVWFMVNPNQYTLDNGRGNVICGIGFFYDDTVETTLLDVKKMEELALLCVKDQDARTETDIAKNAVRIGGEVCVINWDLTSKAHQTAFEYHCNK